LRDGFLAELLDLVERYTVGSGAEPDVPIAAVSPAATAFG